MSSPASSDEDFSSTAMPGDDASDNEGYTKEISRQSRSIAGRADSPSSFSTVRSPRVGNTVTGVFVPKDPTRSLHSVNKLQLSRILEVHAPGLIKETRVNPQKDLRAIDGNSSTAAEIFIVATSLCKSVSAIREKHRDWRHSWRRCWNSWRKDYSNDVSHCIDCSTWALWFRPIAWSLYPAVAVYQHILKLDWSAMQFDLISHARGLDLL